MSNSPLELHSADFGIFGASQTPSLVSAPKIPKNYESQTENPSVVVVLPRIYESKRESIIFRHCEANRRFAEAIHKNKSARSANPCKSFCFVLLLQKVESPLLLKFNLTNKAGSTNPTQQTIEAIAVEIVEFLPNFGRETRLGVCERPKFGKSTQDAPKSELKKTHLQKEIFYDS